MKRPIVAFHQDSEAQWVAELACGHRQHTRHAPPLSERVWVLTPEGRQARIGAELDCAPCDRKAIPSGYEPYRRTPVFDEGSIPPALLRHHATKPGIWGRIHVIHGSVDYLMHEPFDSTERLTADCPGVVVPEVDHRLEVSGPVSLFVEFWRPAGVGQPGPPGADVAPRSGC
jgi:tellurite methyltransferase